MIRTLDSVLTLERPCLGLDLETTGVNPKTSAIVELGLEIMAPGKPTREYRTLVRPMMPIPPEATAIHGITNEMVNAEGVPTFRQLADNLIKGMVGCDFAGYNVFFDLRQLVVEFKRAGHLWDYEGARVIDAFRIWQVASGRTLDDAWKFWVQGDGDDAITDQEIIEAMGDGASHSAIWDVKRSTRIIASQLVRCSRLPRDIQGLHDLCWPDRIDAEGKLKRREDGKIHLTFGQHQDLPLMKVQRGYLQWMLSSDFSERVKNIVSRVLQGEDIDAQGTASGEREVSA